MLCKGWAGLLLVVLPSFARAEITSYHNANPVGWMHMLPVGETPGWTSKTWFNLEINEANIWGTPLTMTDRRNGDTYTYRADFDQTSVIADIGFQLHPRLAFALEIPYANHNSGFLDDFIDQFHVFIQTTRFERNDYPKYQNHFTVTKNGQELLNSNHAEGVGGFKSKMKLWLKQWRGKSKGACECGLALSAQVKFPVQAAAGGLSSGSYDYTGLVHAGIPLWQESGFWFTGGLTRLGKNHLFEGWPMREWVQMYEGTLNLGLSKSWGLLLQMRYESPLFRKEDLDIVYTETDEHNRSIERVNSGWNSLVHWRGSESIGFRYQFANGSQINLLLIEDWGRGKYDSSGAFTYINNAPDVEFITQWHFVF